MPGLIRGMARTAVIAGTATAASNAVNRRQADRNMRAYGDAAQQYQQQAPPPQPTQPPGTGGAGDTLEQLERLGQLKAQGVLTEQEFASEKARILGQ